MPGWHTRNWFLGGPFIRMQKTSGWILALIVLAPSFLCADTVVAIWTEQQVTIAADSKRMVARNGNTRGTENGCKLQPAALEPANRDLVVATAGLVSNEEEDLVA